MLHPSDHFCGPPLDPLQQVHVCPLLRAPELDAGLQVRSHQGGVEGQNHPSLPAGHAAFDATQDTVDHMVWDVPLVSWDQLSRLCPLAACHVPPACSLMGWGGMRSRKGLDSV